MEKSCPELKTVYEKEEKIKKSFTPEQTDFICYQIGEWYLKWKQRIAPGEHRLGVAKEELKEMICGDE